MDDTSSILAGLVGLGGLALNDSAQVSEQKAYDNALASQPVVTGAPTATSMIVPILLVALAVIVILEVK
ncbi:MAG TPA: hypothetical protein VGG48_19100 [Rhizomicrobium sp.]